MQVNQAVSLSGTMTTFHPSNLSMSFLGATLFVGSANSTQSTTTFVRSSTGHFQNAGVNKRMTKCTDLHKTRYRISRNLASKPSYMLFFDSQYSPTPKFCAYLFWWNIISGLCKEWFLKILQHSTLIGHFQKIVYNHLYKGTRKPTSQVRTTVSFYYT